MGNTPEQPLQPAVVTVGNELIYGERSNANQNWLLKRLWECGIPARIALSLTDDKAQIAAEIRHLKSAGYFPVLVSGGIGGTHDDVTRQGIAAGLDLPLEQHAECHAILTARYGDRYSPQRQRMTELPRGSELIANPLGAPGFHCQGVYGFPGFPNMLQPMFESILPTLLGNHAPSPPETHEYTLPTSEGTIASPLEAFSIDHPEVDIGIYPSTSKMLREVTVRLRYRPADRAVADAFDALMAELRANLPDDQS